MKYISPHRFSELYLILEKIDMELAETAHEKPCAYCSGQLDIANYYRKIRGIGDDKPVIRFGLCCRKEGCRKRTKVESIRFLGGFIYSSFVVLLASSLNTGDHSRFKNVVRHLGMSSRTLRRWQHFWNKIFDQTSFWKEQKGKGHHFFPLSQSCKGSF